MIRPALFILLQCAVAAVLADGAMQGPEAITVTAETGTADGRHVFVPDTFTFERGRYYELLIHNPSQEEHYFTSDEMATHVFTRKVEVLDAGGRTIAEVHGPINDLELKPGATLAWYFYPMTKGENMRLVCHKEGHEADGMVGKINITGPPPFTK